MTHHGLYGNTASFPSLLSTETTFGGPLVMPKRVVADAGTPTAEPPVATEAPVEALAEATEATEATEVTEAPAEAVVPGSDAVPGNPRATEALSLFAAARGEDAQARADALDKLEEVVKSLL